jgi:hypothetical protein
MRIAGWNRGTVGVCIIREMYAVFDRKGEEGGTLIFLLPVYFHIIKTF